MRRFFPNALSVKSVRSSSVFQVIMLVVIFSGVLLNFHLIDEIRQSQDDANFVNLVESLAFSVNEKLGEVVKGGDLTEESVEFLQSVHRIMRMNIQDRLYIVTRQTCYRIFPERMGPSNLMDPSRSAQQWQVGWKGTRVLIPRYFAHDKKPVKALVIPCPFNDKIPDYLIVVERIEEATIRVERLTLAIQVLLVCGFVCSLIILAYQTTSFIRAFNRLDLAMTPLSSLEKDINPASFTTDTVCRAIEVVERSSRLLMEKQARLDEMTSSLSIQNHETDEDDVGRTVLASIGIGMLIFDRNRVIISATAPARSMLNLSSSGSIGMLCESVFGGGSLICSMLTDALKERRVKRNSQMKMALPGYSSAWLNLSSILLRSHSGMVTGVAFSIMDISDTKRLEERAREQEHLAALGELSAGIAHEIRNPLGVINGNADLLMDDLRGSDSESIVQSIKDEVSSLNRIITDFLSFARPVQLRVVPIDLRCLCEELIEELRITAPEKITFDIDISPNVSAIQIDEALFRQVISIIITNSIQSIGEEGSIRLLVSRHSAKDAGKTTAQLIRMEFHDSGSGVKPEHFTQLFKPFFTTKTKGTGLGLSIARKIIMLHHGTIEFDRDIVSGACLVLIIPVEYDPDQTFSNLKG